MNRPVRASVFLGMILVAYLVMCGLIVAAWNLYFALEDARYRNDNPRHTFPVTIRSEMAEGYIWVSDDVAVLIWHRDADASYDPEQVLRGRLKLDATPVGTGFIVLADQIAQGSIELPRDFQLNRYQRRKNEIVMSSHAIENGVYAGGRPFNPGPGEMDGNAWSSIQLGNQISISSVDLTHSIRGDR